MICNPFERRYVYSESVMAFFFVVVLPSKRILLLLEGIENSEKVSLSTKVSFPVLRYVLYLCHRIRESDCGRP